MRDDEREFLALVTKRLAAGQTLRFDEMAQELGRSLDRVMDLARRHGLAPRRTPAPPAAGDRQPSPAADLATDVSGPRFPKRRRS